MGRSRLPAWKGHGARRWIATAVAAALLVVVGLLVHSSGTATTAPGPPTAAITPTGQVDNTYYAKWKNGMPADDTFFPIGVWLQDPVRKRGDLTNAQRFKDVGVNTFVGLWNYPDENRGQAEALTAAGLNLITGTDGCPPSPKPDGGFPCGPAKVSNLDKVAAHAGPILKGYQLADEPDQVVPNGTPEGAGCVPEAQLNDWADRARRQDPTRPVHVNFGPGVGKEGFISGRCRPDHVRYLQACDICSYDTYAGTDTWNDGNKTTGIWAYGWGVDRARGLVKDKKPVWVFVETTHIDTWAKTVDGRPQVSPEEMRSIVWLALVHGARGIEYFCHSFDPGFMDDACLDDQRAPGIRDMMKRVDAEIVGFAPWLNVTNGDPVAVSSSTAIPVHALKRTARGKSYLFSIGSGDADHRAGGSTTATFTIPDGGTRAVTVVGENRTVQMTNGSFTDGFGPYQVHIYEL